MSRVTDGAIPSLPPPQPPGQASVRGGGMEVKTAPNATRPLSNGISSTYRPALPRQHLMRPEMVAGAGAAPHPPRRRPLRPDGDLAPGRDGNRARRVFGQRRSASRPSDHRTGAACGGLSSGQRRQSRCRDKESAEVSVPEIGAASPTLRQGRPASAPASLRQQRRRHLMPTIRIPRQALSNSSTRQNRQRAAGLEQLLLAGANAFRCSIDASIFASFQAAQMRDVVPFPSCRPA